MSALKARTTGVAAASSLPTRDERERLLRALLLSRGLERSLLIAGHRASCPGPVHELPAAVSVAAALHPADTLFAPHDLLTAHVARGAAPADLLAARLGREHASGAGQPLAAIAPGAVVPLALGSALAIAAAARPELAVAIVTRGWLEDEPGAQALDLARRRGLPLAVVAIDSESRPWSGAHASVDRDEPEAVHGAVRTMLAAIREGQGHRILHCAPLDPAESGSSPRRTGEAGTDALRRYEHHLSVHGFSRPELSQVRTSALAEVREAAAIASSRPAEAWAT